MPLNHTLADRIVNLVVGRMSRPNGPVVSLECRFPELLLLQAVYQTSFDEALAEAIRTIDSMTYHQRFGLFSGGYNEVPRAPSEEQDGDFQFMRRWTRILATTEPETFAANIDVSWQCLRERLVGGLRRSHYPYVPVTDLPKPSDG